jgi:hypothetical protein
MIVLRELLAVYGIEFTERQIVSWVSNQKAARKKHQEKQQANQDTIPT